MLSKLKTSKSIPGLNRVKDNNGLMKKHIIKTINMLIKTKQKKSKRQPTKH